MVTVLELERILATAAGLVMLAADDEDVGAADVLDDTAVSRFLFPTSFLLAPV